MPEVSVAIAETLIWAPGPPSCGRAWKLKANGAGEVAAKASLRKKSTKSTSWVVPTLAVTVEMPSSTTWPLLDAVRPSTAGGVLSVVMNV